MVVTTSRKQEVWLCQPNHVFGSSNGRLQSFLPYSAGLLWVSAMANQDVANCYKLGGFVFSREPIQSLITRMDKPSVVALSCYVWNAKFCYAIGKAVKEAFPHCLVVLGGPHVPHHDDDFFRKHPWADVLIHYEGEESFTTLLHRLLFWDGQFPIRGVFGAVSRCPDGSAYKSPKQERKKDLDSLPSPYLAGVFDGLYLDYPNHEWHVLLETDRGCPYSCTFCDWGAATYTKVRRFSQERAYAELDWASRHHCELVVNCDANFGMFPESETYIEYMVKKKRDTGYPKKFRASYAKHSGERIYRLNRMLNEEKMSKGATLSFQSMDEHTLEVIKRKNIGTKVYSDLMRKYRAEGIPTYSELIIGLPGETYNSWANSLDLMISSGQHDSIHAYQNALLPNSEQNQLEYKEKHGIKSAVTPMTTFHSDPVSDRHQEEFEVVIGTNTLSFEDWIRCGMLAFAVQTFHCLNLTQSIAVFLKAYQGLPYRSFYEALLRFARANPETLLGKTTAHVESLYRGIPDGKEWGIVDCRFGSIIWPPEEGAFLQMVVDRYSFYRELIPFLGQFVEDDHDILCYQRLTLPNPDDNGAPVFMGLNYNLHEYLEAFYRDEPIPLENKRSNYRILRPKDFAGNLERYAKEQVWFARKGGGPNRHKVERIDP